MYAKFKWDFLNGKSKSHIDLTVGFNCIVCHIFKLFTNQHFNYSVYWQTIGQIKSSILKCCCKVCNPKITRLFSWGEWRNEKTEQASWRVLRFRTDSPKAWGCPVLPGPHSHLWFYRSQTATSSFMKCLLGFLWSLFMFNWGNVSLHVFKPWLPSIVYLNGVGSLGSLGPSPFVMWRLDTSRNSILPQSQQSFLSCLPPWPQLG